MSKRDPRETYHDRISHRYEGVYDTAYWRLYREISWRHLNRFLPRDRPARALDLGCGPGWFGLRLLKAGFGVTFLDISTGMVDQARAQAELLGRPEETRFVKADMQDMGELESGSFHFATAQGDTLGFTEKPQKALKELARVLHPGGKAVLSVDHRAPASRAFVERGSIEELAEFLKTGRTEWLAKKREDRFLVHMFDLQGLKGMLEKQGFQVLDVICKLALFRRQDERLLAKTPMKTLIALEERVHGRPGWLGLGSHLQVATQKE